MMLHLPRILAAALALGVATTGCAGGAANQEQPNPKGPAITACTQPRPEICTQEYDPVCALRDAAGLCVSVPCDSATWRTYANACTACSDPKVLGYRPGGACKD